MNILLFGVIRETAGTDKISWVDELSTLNELKKSIEEKYPFLKKSPYRFAVNQKLVTDMDIHLTQADNVALLPPFSGG